MPGDINPLAETVFQMVKAGHLNAVSVGFTPLEHSRTSDKSRPGGLDIKKQELLEVSVVPIPALPQAIIQARSLGIKTAPIERWASSYLTPEENSMSNITRRAASAASIRLPTDHAKSGFKTFGEFAQAVMKSSAPGERPDPRLVRAPGPGILGETDPSSGGFLVPSQWEDGFISSLYEHSPLYPLLAKLKSSKPSETRYPGVDETSRANGLRWGGVQSYWAGEADQVAPSWPKVRMVDFSPHKLFAVTPASRELVEDSDLLGDFLGRAFASEFGFMLDYATLFGTGAGMPLGVMQSSALITVAKDTGQTAGTISTTNIENMWIRLTAQSRRRAVWVVNEDVENQLSVTNTTGVAPTFSNMYAPQNTVGGNQFPLLKGRPVIVSDACAKLGTPGDIVLIDPLYYGVLDPGLTAALSLDFYFVSDEAMFRWVWRLDAKPLISSPITPFNGSGITRSPFVALAQR